MLDLAILGLLEKSELHGYEIRRQLRQTLGILANVSFGSLYPALSRLETQGAVEATEISETGTRHGTPAVPPPTGSLSGELAAMRARRRSAPRGRRSRKVYRITPAGRVMFTELLADTSGDDARSFGLRLAFARHLAPQARLALLERRRALLFQHLAEVQTMGSRTELDGYARAVVEHTGEAVEQDIAWLDRLIAAERALGAPPADVVPATTPGPGTTASGT